MEGHLDKKVMLLAWKILALPENSVLKQVAIRRFLLFHYEEADTMILLDSPMRNIYKHVQNYGLESDLMNLIHVRGYESYGQWKAKIVKALMHCETEHWMARCRLYPSLEYYSQSVISIDMCSLWMVAIARPDMWEMCRVVLKLVCTYSVMNRMRRCELCDAFVPETLEHIICTGTYFINWRVRFIDEIMGAGVDSSVILMPFVL